MNPRTLRRRFEILRETQCTVLSLSEALTRLRDGTLPERAVVLTFDDGLFDFRVHVAPMAAEFGYPVTVYLSTYYSVYQSPVFPVMLSYLLWKARGRRLSMGTVGVPDVEVTAENHASMLAAFGRHVAQARLHATDKAKLLEEVAAALSIDYAEILRKRILQLMTPEEVASLDQRWVSVELHTHRHRTPTDRPSFEDEIVRNREIITAATGRNPTHLCYPSGRFETRGFEWLRALGVESAVTCQPGLAAKSDEMFALPRFIDTEPTSQSAFRAWVSGVAQLLPRRKVDHTPEDSNHG
jgi:peptidoglycan/xylan/chitin deacetylase (PgdA/CDA1 family)